MFEKNVYVSRRQRLIQQIGSGIILFIGNAESSMNYKDNLYPFRQDSSFLYFFGADKTINRRMVAIINNTETFEAQYKPDQSNHW